MTRALSLLFLCTASLGVAGSGAVSLPNASGIADPALQARYYSLQQQVRCPQCDGQSLSGSSAPMAQDMKRSIAEQLQQGASDAQVLEWVAQRYGNRALFLPPLDGSTLWLWLPVPIIVLAVALLALHRWRRRVRN